MPREKECYRDNLMRIDKRFPGKELLNIKEVAEFLGISPRKAKKDYFETDCTFVSKVKLASLLS